MEWRPHPSLPLEANAEGVVRYKGRALPPRLDKDGYHIASFGGRDNPRTIKIHRVVLACFEGESPLEVDHEDRNRTNNRRDNLRYASISKNRRNVGVNRRSSTGVRCVRPNKSGDGFVAYCNRNKKYVHLGVFPTIEAAKAAAEPHYYG